LKIIYDFSEAYKLIQDQETKDYIIS